MIITRTPFRVSFAGGGSDIASFYEKHEGCVLSTAINKYMYISVHPSFSGKETVLKYSKTEAVTDINQIEHKYFKKMLQILDVKGVEFLYSWNIECSVRIQGKICIEGKAGIRGMRCGNQISA